MKGQSRLIDLFIYYKLGTRERLARYWGINNLLAVVFMSDEECSVL